MIINRFFAVFIGGALCSDEVEVVSSLGMEDDVSIDLREFSRVDPCITYCNVAEAGDCSKVQAQGDICHNLAYGLGDQIRVSFSSHPDVRRVTKEEAFAAVSTDSCQKACQATTGCGGSFCKPNGHCKALLWDDLKAGTFCFHDGATNNCVLNTPLHCVPPTSPGTTEPLLSTVSPVSTVADDEDTTGVAGTFSDPAKRINPPDITSTIHPSGPVSQSAGKHPSTQKGPTSDSKSQSGASLQSSLSMKNDVTFTLVIGCLLGIVSAI